jgi:glycosyltransferase involved in cell wall biosynthesis
MKVLLYWHDIYLPYSDYLIRGFASNLNIGQLCIVGPENYEAESIYSGSRNNQSFSEKIIFQKIKTYSFRKKWGSISEFKKCIQEFRPDCIIVLDEAFSVNVLNAAIANYLAKNKATVLFYGFENIKQTPPFQFLAENFSLKNIWVFIRKTIRYFLADALLQPIRSRLVSGGLVCYQESVGVVHQFGWNPKINMCWWGLDLKPFLELGSLSASDKRHDFEATNGVRKTIGYVGRFIEEKGVLDLLESIAKLGDQYHLVLVGAGPQEDQLIRRIQELLLQGRVKLIAPQSRDALAKLYASFDVLVLPSRTDYFWKEQYGRVLVEAMACGTPVVGSQSGAIPIVIGNPSRCFIEADVAQMADTIELAITQFQGGNTKDMRNALKKRAQLGNIDGFVNAFVELHLELRAHQP